MNPEEKKARAREKARAYYYANKERYLERGRAWRAANKEKVKAYNATYHADHRGRENARAKAWKEENREAMNARRRAAYAPIPSSPQSSAWRGADAKEFPILSSAAASSMSRRCVALKMTASVGFSLFPSHAENAAGLLQRAERALYRAKIAGRDCYYPMLCP